MKNKTKLAIGLSFAIVAASSVAFAEYAASPQPSLNGAIATDEQAVQLATGNLGASRSEKVGSVSGPDNPNFPYWSINGVTTQYRRQSFVSTNASTTPCSIQSPNATTSVLFADLNITTATSSAVTWVLASSTTAYATTTSWINTVIAANSQGSIVFQPGVVAPYVYGGSAVNATSTGIMPPNTYLVWGAQGGTISQVVGNGAAVTGTCQAEFVQL